MNIQEHLPILLVAIPILMSALMIMLRSRPTFQKILNIIVSASILLMSIILLLQVWKSGIQVYEVGEWGKYGIILVADLLGSGMVVLSSGISLLALIYSLDYIEGKSLNTTYHSLFNLLVAGLNGTFLTGDIFNMFVFFEILLLSSCGLVVASENGGVTKVSDKMEATFKYLILNIIGSMLMLVAVASLYATVGTLNMADLSVKISALSDAGTLPWHIYFIALLFLIVFGNKAAIFPLHYWLPDVHPTAPSPISAMLSGVMIKVGAYGILRVYFLVFKDALFLLQPIIILLALITIAIGAIAAVGQNDVKRLLAYSSVSQIGYVFLGIGMGTAYALAASLVYLVNHAIAKSMLFLTSGGIIHHAKTRDMHHMGGMVKSAPLMSSMFLIGAMSIAGMPPLGGFIAKFVLFDAAMLGEYYLPVLIGFAFAVFTIFYMFRAWLLMFWGEARDFEKYGPYSSHRPSPMITVPIIILAAAVLILGVYSEPLISLSSEIANQLLNPQPYINAVLGGSVR
ncbi:MULTISPECIES: proton-conducting transporter transmembrane domain-containing protein [Methanohalophilus]|jgi:multicomponent Na+:H+ antiporter subunit D|uniref:Cation:proton antiporter n=1 Tax=Methanohalophilus euhalobius TaxID=51203 RepID=A0A314ZZS0_9EURY|nr:MULTISPECIES: proton-conducting transporter membrane subunit [Methanohalophilus]KXS46974.1 MAG: multicomponent Na+:H+ antiporter subunit D [Methanohalophilus sp. T328-1]RSD34871.1 MAG: multicomponent Na+:H+ antiporter subunit D [Methanohalophilus sp.]OBZ36092.1 MAG: cation:proton antiporter [Methanohalophilus sp. DAL1]PQV42588.1 multisubunit sodium/proton antiporter MrpD subunit [Methanohalophilus euhalobius]RNI08626.1 cation:proton antiporter [Methanohalophilus euhalobius]